VGLPPDPFTLSRRTLIAMRMVAAGIAVIGLLAGVARAQSLLLQLPRTPYLGLACDNGAVLHCERVGLAVWLEKPARSVTARLDGHSVTLGTRAGGSPAYARGLFWQGFFRDPHAQALADASRSIPVRVRVTMQTGEVRIARALVYVSEGYG
jgi:hypothetical protein